MFRKKTHGQVIGAELQEGLTHISNAVAEAGRAAAEQLGPRVEAARDAAGSALSAATTAVEATVATKVAPKVAAAAAVAAPAVLSAREAVGSRVEAARDVTVPALESAQKAFDARLLAAVDALTPHMNAPRGAAAPRVATALAAAQKALNDDVTTRVAAARESLTPVFDNARGTVAAGLETARGEVESRYSELATTTADVRKRAAKRRQQLEKRAAQANPTVKQRLGLEPQPQPRRWVWAVALLGALAAVTAVVLRRRKSDDLWPSPAGDGPVPSYREDPVPTSPSDSGKTVSTAQGTPGDGTPGDSDLGWRSDTDQPAAGSATPNDPSLDTATAAPGNQPQTASEGTGAEGGDGSQPGSAPRG